MCLLYIQVLLILVFMTGLLYAQDVKHNLRIDTNVDYKINNKPQKPIKNSYSFEVFQSEFEANIEFLAYSPLGDMDNNNLNGSDVSLEEDGIFTPIKDRVLQDNAIQGKKNIPLVPVNFVKDGQLIFIRITDKQKNKDPNKIETVVATLQALTGNNFASVTSLDNNLLNLHSKRVLRLYETGEDTGIFIGYIPFRIVAENHNIDVENFTIVSGINALISVSYREKNTGILKQDYLMVNVKVRPEGRVFNSLTGEYLDGLNVSLIDAQTGNLATVFGGDGKTPFPATVKTGQDTVDMVGNNIGVDKGEYFFPYVPAGQYRLRIDNLSESLIFPSTMPLQDLQTLAIPSLVIEEGGRGQVFEVTTATSIGLDIPLDVFGKINLTKTATKNTASAGELVPYTLRLTNADNRSIRGLTLSDDPARELRYVGGSLLVDGVPHRDFMIDEKTMRMSVTLPDLPPKTTVKIEYAMRVLPAVADSRILRNTAQAFGNGGFVSNLATADVMVTDDMLQTYGTVVGRVYFDGCSTEEKQKKDIVGLPNIRLFNQNGDQVLTDKDGKFSFSAVKKGLNVYQLDKVTLPEGVEVSLCKDDTRHAGTAFSQFVDVAGGYVYKVNFTLKGDKEKYRKIQEDMRVAEENSETQLTPQQQQSQINELPEDSMIRRYDERWLDTQKIEFKLVYPGENYHPGIRSLNFGVTYPSGHKVIPYMNDIPVSQLNKDSVIANAQDTLRLVHYRGVDLQRDSNILRLELRDKENNLIQEIKHEIVFNQLIYKAELQKEKSILRADGLTNPEIVLKLTDKQNVAIASGRPVRVDVSAPYGFLSGKNLANFEALNQENISGGTQNVAMGQEGLLTVKLNPTTQSGRVVLRIYLSENDYKEVEVWLESEKRDWILVGLADGSVAYNTIKGNMETAGITADKIDPDIGTTGKIAFYSKGMISSDWLMTLSFDNTRKKESEKMRLFRQIAPNQKFAVLGDLSRQSSDASSQYPLYLKLERDHFYALFGDYDTAITNSELMPYARRLSGFQTLYSGENFSVQVFAAEEGQDFFRDDIRLDGTSGPYKLNGMNIIQNSDRVFLETRKLSDPAEVLNSQPLSRYVDYDIDYQDGIITLRSNNLPYNITTEFAFLRVEFETYNGDAKGEPTYGSRVTTNFLGQDVKLGMTAIHDGGGRAGMGGSDGYATDLEMKLFKDTVLEMEYATTQGEKGDRVGNFVNSIGTGQDERDGSALRTEIVHKGEQLYMRGFYVEKENGFGLGTSSGFDAASIRYGAELIYDFDKRSDTPRAIEEDGFKISDGLSFYARMNEMQDTGGRGDVSVLESGFSKKGNDYNSYLGVRQISENVNFSYDAGSGIENFNAQSDVLQLMSGAEIELIQNKLTVFGSNELPLNSGNNTLSLYGNKTAIGANIKPFAFTSVMVGHEWVDLNGREFQNTNLGVSVQPLDDTTISVGGRRYLLPDQEMMSLDTRLMQNVKLSDAWTLNLGVQRHEAMGGKNGIYSEIYDVPDYALPYFIREGSVRSPFNTSSRGYWESYNSFVAGVLRSEKEWNFHVAGEVRSAETEDRFNLSSSLVGNITQSFAAGLSGRYQISNFKNGMTNDKFIRDLEKNIQNYGLGGIGNISQNRLSLLKDSQVATIIGGTAYRPFDEDGPIILHRTDLELQKNSADDSFFKAVNNFAVQYDVTDDLELNGQYAVKYVRDKYNGLVSDDWVNILGTSWRYDISKKWDIGFSVMARHSVATKTTSYSTGLSTGYSPAKNMYIQVGYNFSGFDDQDFTLQNHTAQGVFLRFNIKFDQENIKEQLQHFMS